MRILYPLFLFLLISFLTNGQSQPQNIESMKAIGGISNTVTGKNNEIKNNIVSWHPGFIPAGDDTVMDLGCDTLIFFGITGNAVHHLQITGTTSTDLGTFTPALSTPLGSVAYGLDITSGGIDHTYFCSGFSPPQILKFDGVSWLVVNTDTIIHHQAGAYGPYIYFMRAAANGQPNDQRISRLNAGGSLVPIFTDTSLRFTVADLAVDTAGNIYCFRGPQIGNTTEMTVISPTGVILNSYNATSFGTLSTIYGMMFYKGSLYIGQGTNNGVFIPVIISGSSVSLGTPVNHPTGMNYSDLASCPSFPIPTAIEDESLQEFQCYPNPVIDYLVVKSKTEKSVQITINDINGREIYRNDASPATTIIETSSFPSAVYILTISTGKSVKHIKVLKN
jgi:hypothetical protein